MDNLKKKEDDIERRTSPLIVDAESKCLKKKVKHVRLTSCKEENKDRKSVV